MRKRTRSTYFKDLLEEIKQSRISEEIDRLNNFPPRISGPAGNGYAFFRPFDLPVVDFNEWQQRIPDGGGVYFLTHRLRIVYIGKSSSFSTRISEHLRSDKVFSRARLLFLPAEVDAGPIEKDYISRINPIYNKQHRTGDKSEYCFLAPS